jgi:bla regulator protein blaR1
LVKLRVAQTFSAILIWSLRGFAQAPPEPKFNYEVASVKKSDPAARGTRISPGPQGGLRTTNTNLLLLLTFAYDVRDYQILEAPGWAKSEGFDISFTPDKPEAVPQSGGSGAKSMETMMDRQRQRMQSVLRDRFGVKLRLETRDLPICVLTLAKGGSKLRTPSGAGKGPSMMMNPEKGELVGVGADMRMLTNVLSNILRRPVIDQTGIDGVFDMKLQWSPQSQVGGTADPLPGETPLAETDSSSIFTAMTEQLGLRLESSKGPVKVYVVEKAERPGEN